MNRSRAIAELWRRGVLSWKLHNAQADISQTFKTAKSKKFVLNCSRRLGKSYWLCTMAAEQCLKKPYSQVRFAAPNARELKKIVLPLFRQLFADCPKPLLPEYKKQDQVYLFQNGSEIHLAGTDNGHAESLRGTSADLGIVDEGGFVDELDYLVKDILLPQLMYNDEGRIIIASTPPRSPAHDFVKYVVQAQLDDAYSHKTIYDNPMLTPAIIQTYIDECGGRETTTFRREFMAEIVTEETAAVIPEFNAEVEKVTVRDWKRPSMFNCFTIGDLGFKDATAILFGYYDFDHAKIVIEDELIMHAPSSSEIAAKIKQKESELYGDLKIFQRFADGDLIVLQDISKTHGVTIAPVKKDVLEAQVNQLRLDIQNRSVIIHPRCKTTITHLKYGIWDKARKRFDRSDDFYHFDALAALIYFVRHVSRDTNPYPWDYQIDPSTHHIPEDYLKSGLKSGWRKLAR